MPAPLTFPTWFTARHPEVPLSGADAVLRLAGEGATVPFIARYRKEQTGNLDEVAIQRVLDASEAWDEIVKRQTFIVEEIERQGKLTPGLRDLLLSTFDLAALEDLYLPYKQKRKTRATVAREAGLEPLAAWLWGAGHGEIDAGHGEIDAGPETPEERAGAFVDPDKGVADVAVALNGAVEILVERLSEDAGLRQRVRTAFFERGLVRTRRADGAKSPSRFERYFAHQEPVAGLLQPAQSHRYLAMRRGAAEEELVLTLGGPLDAGDARADDPLLEELLAAFQAVACTVREFAGAPLLDRAARLALRAHVVPAIEHEVHRALREVADHAAIAVFADNIRKLLLAAPFGPKAVLGIDPGLRTGCKLAVVDGSGRYVGGGVIHLETPGGQAEAAALVADLVGPGRIQAVAVGNGTAGREAEAFARHALREAGLDVPVVMVSEAGASVYSASEVAREEFPDLDVTVRGAISIARRLQDPLAELVKIDPRSIGVGQYQHDVTPGALRKSLDHVVDSCVNHVGVNLNTASTHLLGHVSGIGPGLARAIVAHRSTAGLFRSRTALLDVPRFSRKTFEQAAGFLRIPEGEHALDATGVHPERYAVLEGFARRLGVPVADLLGPGVERLRGAGDLRQELGPFTFDDIVRELEKPGRDPRDHFVPFSYRADVHTLEDLQPGMVCPGIVTNVTNFGAFVDIGVHQDGLVHISQLADRFVTDPHAVVSPGDRVTVRVLEVKRDRRQIALTMKSERPAPSERSARADRDEATSRPDGPRTVPRGTRPEQDRVEKQRSPAGGRRPSAPADQGAAPGGRTGPPDRGRGERARPPQRRTTPPAPAPQPQTPFNNPFAGLEERLRNR